MIKVSLKDLYTSERVMETLSALGLNPHARPEELSLDNFLALYHALK